MFNNYNIQMNKYESIIIIKPTLTEEEIKDTINKYKKTFEEFSDRAVEVEDLGKKKLAYEVQGNKEGNYVVFNFYGSVKNMYDIEKIYRADDNVMKFLTMKTEENFETMEDENEEEEER